MIPIRRAKRARRGLTVATVGLVIALTGALPATADVSGDSEACTPGYWKNHTDNWREGPNALIDPGTTLGQIFPSLATAYPHLADDTMLEALNYRAFRGDEGKLRNLLKHAVGAWLNAAYDDAEGHLLYPLRRHSQGEGPAGFDGIVPEVEAAIASGDTGAMEELKDLFDGIANRLPCPLS